MTTMMQQIVTALFDHVYKLQHPFPLTANTINVLSLTEAPDGSQLIISTRDFIEYIFAIVTQWDMDVHDRNIYLKSLIENLNIKPFCDPLVIQNPSKHLNHFFALSDLSACFKIHLKDCNFTNVSQYDIKVKQKCQIMPNQTCTLKCGSFEKNNLNLEPRQMPEGYPLEQLCFHTVLVTACIVFYKDEITSEMLHGTRSISIMQKMLREKSSREIWNALL